VKAVVKYVAATYSVTECPGQGLDGHFYYLVMLSKALAAYAAPITRADGSLIDWRHDVVRLFVGLQREDGSWVNESGRFMESMPPLATAYAMIALKTALGPAE
jgi:squalene-hopene/tetraprenyl-beta-curcumene cyclase